MNVQADELATHTILSALKKDKRLDAVINPFCKAYLRNGNMYRTN
jgi:hypothetical protein